jgi:fatty acid desaturase
MDKPVSDPSQPYRSLIAGYTEAIRSSDFKANIAFLFVAFMMGSVLWNYTGFPSYLPVQIVLLPFLIVYFCLFMVLLPRYPKRGAKTF